MSRKYMAEHDLENDDQLRSMALVDQIHYALLKQNRTALLMGLVYGTVAPALVWWVKHHELPAAGSTWLAAIYWAMVLGGCVFSAKSVYDWGQAAFSQTAKSLGFTILVELAMTFVSSVTVSLTCLVLLASINITAVTCKLATDRRKSRDDRHGRVRLGRRVKGQVNPFAVAVDVAHDGGVH